MRSKSDISDRYWRPSEPPISHLEQFFEHLGLTSDTYEDMLSNSRSSDSPVFFSDVSTVDSSRPIDNVDYCPTSNYRTSEPPSIVERNARIIKWLCNCRKSQLTWTLFFDLFPLRLIRAFLRRNLPVITILSDGTRKKNQNSTITCRSFACFFLQSCEYFVMYLWESRINFVNCREQWFIS